jgi:hypothetical protein
VSRRLRDCCESANRNGSLGPEFRGELRSAVGYTWAFRRRDEEARILVVVAANRAGDGSSFALHSLLARARVLNASRVASQYFVLQPRLLLSSSSPFAPAHSLLCLCSESPWPGRFFLPSCSSHLCFFPWLPPLSFVSILFLCPFSVIPLCS